MILCVDRSILAETFGKEQLIVDGDGTGMHPQAASVRWKQMRLPELLTLTITEARDLFSTVHFPSTADRLCSEIQRRLDALNAVGLGYLSLDRSAPLASKWPE